MCGSIFFKDETCHDKIRKEKSFMKNEKDVKNFQLKFRVSEQEKEKILNYCEEHNFTISEFLRAATANMIHKSGLGM